VGAPVYEKIDHLSDFPTQILCFLANGYGHYLLTKILHIFYIYYFLTVSVIFHPHRGEPQAILSWENDPGSVDPVMTRENPDQKIRHSPAEIRSIRPGETDFRVFPAGFPRREALKPLSSSRDQPLLDRRIRATVGACLGVGGRIFSFFGRSRIRNSLPHQI